MYVVVLRWARCLFATRDGGSCGHSFKWSKIMRSAVDSIAVPINDNFSLNVT